MLATLHIEQCVGRAIAEFVTEMFSMVASFSHCTVFQFLTARTDNHDDDDDDDDDAAMLY